WSSSGVYQHGAVGGHGYWCSGSASFGSSTRLACRLRTGGAHRPDDDRGPVVLDATYDENASDESGHRARCVEAESGVAHPGDGDGWFWWHVRRVHLHFVDHD